MLDEKAWHTVRDKGVFPFQHWKAMSPLCIGALVLPQYGHDPHTCMMVRYIVRVSVFRISEKVVAFYFCLFNIKPSTMKRLFLFLFLLQKQKRVLNAKPCRGTVAESIGKTV